MALCQIWLPKALTTTAGATWAWSVTRRFPPVHQPRARARIACRIHQKTSGASIVTSLPGFTGRTTFPCQQSESTWAQNTDFLQREYSTLFRTFGCLTVCALGKKEGGKTANKVDKFRPRAYKFRFKKWGLRKNIKEHEARELVSGNKNPGDFWAGTRGLNFERRIARHMEKTKDGRSSRQGSRQRSPQAFDMTIKSSTHQPQRRLSAISPYEALLAAKHYWEIWSKSGSPSYGGIWLHGEAGLERSVADESTSHFFPLFERGLHALSCGQETQRAFADVDKSFTYLNGLIMLRHPFIYVRILNLASAYRQFPHVEVCYRVCCLLLDYCLGLLRTLYGQDDPVCCLWSAITDMLQAQDEPQYFDDFQESAQGTCSAVWKKTRGYMELGSVRLEAYIASPQRYHDEATLRRQIARPTTPNQDDAILTPALQESRLALAELLINQGRTLEAVPILTEAQHYKSLDFINPEGKGFWLAELAWRAGNPQRSIEVLESVLGALDSRSPTDHSNPPTVSALQILALLQHRHSMLLSTSQAEDCQRRIAVALANKNMGQNVSPSPTLLHLAACDYEVPAGLPTGGHIHWRPSP